MNEEDLYLSHIYQRFPISINRGKGAKVWDVLNKEYIDCMGGYGVAIVGHCNERVVQAIKEQAEQLITCHMSLYNESRLKFLNKLASLTPPGLERVFFSNSGAEAIEAALKFSRKFSGKTGIVAMKGAYHGKTFGALSVTYNDKYRSPFKPLLEGVRFVPYGQVSKLEEEIDDNIGSVILEPIQGETGIIVPPDGFLEQVREICDRRKLVLIFDEIQSGLGRTGKMWAGQHWNTVPDVMCLAKGIAGGIPMGLTLTKPEIIECMKVGEHSSTFSGNPLACAAGLATLESLTEDKLVENAGKIGKFFRENLIKLQEKHRIMREVRGRGMMLGIEMRFDVRDLLLDAINEGLLMLYSGRNVIRLLPPIVMDEFTVTKATNILDRVISAEEKRRNVY